MKKFSMFVLLAVLMLTACTRQADKEVKPNTQTVEQQLASAKIELDKKNYGKTIEITIRVTQSDPKNAEAYYLEAQAQSLAGSARDALASLEEALKNGFKDFKGLLDNHNFDSVKQTPEFELLMQRYNPDASAKATISDKEVKAGDTSIKEENGQKVIKAGDIEIRIPKD
jgi:hypothetical protein